MKQCSSRKSIWTLSASALLTLTLTGAIDAQTQDPPPDTGNQQGAGEKERERGDRPIRTRDGSTTSGDRTGNTSNTGDRLPEGERQEGEKPDRDRPEGGAGAEANDTVKDAGLDPKSAEARVLRRVMREEAKHRTRLAKINRLRELATEQGNEERLAALDKLEAKMVERHEANVARAKSEIGKDKSAALEERLNKGRGKGRGRGKSGDKARGGKGEGDDDDENHADDNDEADHEDDDDDDEGHDGRPEGAGADKARGGKPDADDDRKRGGKPEGAGADKKRGGSGGNGRGNSGGAS